MIIVKLDGGMGNQMFQYAVGKYLSLKLKAKLKLDTDTYLSNKSRHYALDHLSTEENFSTQREKKSLHRKEYFRRKLNKIGFSISPYWCTEQEPGYHNYIEQLTDNVYLEGFWQSEKYFKPIEEIIRKEFVVKEVPAEINKKHLDKIESVNAVSVHIRRGDYMSDKTTNEVHGVCDISYYDEAINRMTAEVNDPSFFIFSDDMAWAKAHLSIDDGLVTYVDNNSGADYEDIRLMYSCKHHIIANSSFSWWGAWLNTYRDKKVIAPKKWFRSVVTNKDIIPDGWLTI